MDNTTTHHPVRFVSIDENNDNQRLDNFLMTQLKGIPKGRIYKMFRKGEVRVNKGRVKPSHRLAKGDVVRIPPVMMNDRPDVFIPQGFIDATRQSIIFEDESVIVLNKQAGVAVHSGTNINYGIIEALKSTSPGYLELAHRLDRYTSGCLLIAKNARCLKYLHQQFRDNSTEKFYHCLVVGSWRDANKTVETGLSRGGSGIRKTSVDADGRLSVSHFTLLETFDSCSFMQVRIETGFTHQIRVHAHHCGHPIVGDNVYGDFALNKQFKNKGVKRQLLHASMIRFRTSDADSLVTVEAALSDDFEHVLAELRSQ